MLKKIICLILLLLISFAFTGCVLHADDDNPKLDINENAAYEGKFYNDNDSLGDEDSFIFTWMTYSEIAVTDKLKEKSAYEKHINSLFERMKRAGITDCFVHVRPFADAMYSSEYYPLSIYSQKAKDFDPLQVIVSLGESYDIGIHAWVNPYRISSKPLSENSSYYESYCQKTSEIISVGSGVYFNPCRLKVQSLIIGGVDELLRNYNIKGIHIDDYFYPPDFGYKDKTDYEVYIKKGGKLSLNQWRKENVNSLVSAIYAKVKSFGEDKMFSISPAGNIKRNNDEIYADVKLWCKGGYCDIILPQIYFGFENETMPFEKCLDSWLELTDSEKVTLIPALALYKREKEDVYAGKGKNEWLENNDVITRQIEMLKSKNCRGFGLYSSSYINFSETFKAE